MTTLEFSNMFDTLLNSYNTQAAFGDAASKADIVLDEYEKSVLLTLAQDIVVKSFFERTGNQQGEGFDDSMRRLVDFSSLITVAEPVAVGENVEEFIETGEEDSEGNPLYIKNTVPIENTEGAMCFDERGVLYSLPKNLLIMLNEKLIVNVDEEGTKTKSFVVVPINYKEYDRLMSRAYNQPLKKQCWRLFLKESNANLGVTTELIPIEGTTISKYRIRYIRRPRPIVLVNLDFSDLESLEIDGYTQVTECELNPILHVEILSKAVELAIATRGGGTANRQQQRAEQ